MTPVMGATTAAEIMEVAITVAEQELGLVPELVPVGFLAADSNFRG